MVGARNGIDGTNGSIDNHCAFRSASAVTIGPVLLVYRIAKHTLWLLAPALLYTTVVVGAWNGFASGFDAILLEAIKHNYADAYALEHMTPRGRSLTCDDKRIELTGRQCYLLDATELSFGDHRAGARCRAPRLTNL